MGIGIQISIVLVLTGHFVAGCKRPSKEPEVSECAGAPADVPVTPNRGITVGEENGPTSDITGRKSATVILLSDSPVVPPGNAGCSVIAAGSQGSADTGEAIVTPSPTGAPKVKPESEEDRVPPTPGSFMPSTSISVSGFTLNWTTASDATTPSTDLEYLICSAENLTTISTASGCIGAAIDMPWQKNAFSHLVSGKSGGTTYFFNLVVRDSFGNLSVYEGIGQATELESGPRWRALLPIDTTGSNPAGIQMAGTIGRTVAVWVSLTSGGKYSVMAARYSATTGWIAAEMISGGVINCSEPSVAINSAGDTVVVWRQEAASDDLWVATYSAQSGWSMPELFADNTHPNGSPKVAISENGTIVATWMTADDYRYNIWGRSYIPGSGWASAQMIETQTGYHSVFPQLAIDSAGSVIVVWSKENSSGYPNRSDIWTNRYSVASGWGVAFKLEAEETFSAVYPIVKIDNSGNAIALWSQSINSAGRRAFAARYSVSTGWGSPFMIESAGSYNDGFDISFDSEGNAVAAWRSWDGSNYSLKVATYSNLLGWAPETTIDGTVHPTSAAGYPLVAHVGNGSTNIVWTRHDGTRTNSYSVPYLVESGFGQTVLIEPLEGGNSDHMRMTGVGNGQVVAAWIKPDGASKVRIVSAVFR